MYMIIYYVNIKQTSSDKYYADVQLNGSTLTLPRYGFRGSKFHRIIPGFMCQGGDFTNHNGKRPSTDLTHNVFVYV